MRIFKICDFRPCLPARRFAIFRSSLLIAFGFLPVLVFSQSPSIITTTDKNSILIGEPLTVTVKATFSAGLYNVNWLHVPDSIAHFELLDPGKIDSSQSNANSKVYEQKIVVTSWDSGKWSFPSLPIVFSPLVDDTILPLSTDSIPVSIMYSPADSTNQLRDIKPIMDVKLSDYTWYFIAGGILLLLIGGYFLWRYYKNWKKKPKPVFAAKLSPFEEAMNELKLLEQYDLTDREQVKRYHTRLSEIFKRYLGRKENRDLSGLTTGEVLIAVKDKGTHSESVSKLASGLRCGDAVKFAKYMPTMVESKESMENIRDVIQLLQ